MFGNFSLVELLVVGALALVVIGPKDLPKMMRSVGKFMGQARGMARQFQDSMSEAAREADLQELNEARKLLNSRSPTGAVTNTLKKTLNFDDDDDDKPKRSPVLDSNEMKSLAEESGFGTKSAESEPKSSLASAEKTSPTADATPDKTASENAKTG